MADAQRLAAVRPDAELTIVEGMNHMLRIVPMDMAQQLASYRNPQLPLARELGERLIAFIRELPDSRNAKHGR
ncbi:hypothetical protein D9M68_961520 [compost metagenome]